MPLVAGVDSSTSGCTVEVRDADTGALVSSGRAPHPPTTPPVSEHHPDVWWAAFQAAASAAGLGDTRRVAAIAVAGQQHGLVALGADGHPLRPAKLWNDTTSAPEAESLARALSPREWAGACGSVPVPALTITKLAWLRRCEPDRFDRLARVMLPHDWLTAHLTGGFTTDRGDASGTGWWSPAENRYRLDLLALVDPTVDWAVRLPAVLGPTEAAGTWQEATVAAGTGDNMAAALGVGLRPGDLAVSLGTSATAFTVSEAPASDPSGAIAGFADATGRFLPLVCTLNATKVFDAVARLLGVDHAGLDTLAASAPPGAGGVVLVPHLDGERTPNRPGATGVLVGLRSDVSRELLARAAVEGVVANLLTAARGLHAPNRVVLTGGGARSRTVRQVVADLTGRPVFVPAADDLVAAGAAVQAAAVLGRQAPAMVSAAWGLDRRGEVIEPAGGTDAESALDRYAEVAENALSVTSLGGR